MPSQSICCRCFVSALVGQLDVLAERGDAQHAAAAGDHLAIPVGGAGVEDVGVLAEAVAGGQAVDDVALLRGVRVVGGGEHDAERDAAVPFGFDLVERAVDAVFEQVDEIGLQAHQDRLGFRVAHAAVEFQRLDRAVVWRSSGRRRGSR